MNYTDQQTLWTAYVGSNIVGLLFLWAAIERTKLARLMFVLLFGWACVINYVTSHNQPEVYLAYADKALPLYSSFISGWFKEHITAFVSLITLGQGLIALGMLLRGVLVNLACAGVIIFLLCIAPLGLYAAFPFSLVVAGAAFIIIRRDDKAYLWQLNSPRLSH